MRNRRLLIKIAGFACCASACCYALPSLDVDGVHQAALQTWTLAKSNLHSLPAIAPLPRCTSNVDCLVTLAHSQRYSTRMDAIKMLASEQRFPDWQRRLVTQRCDSSVVAAICGLRCSTPFPVSRTLLPEEHGNVCERLATVLDIVLYKSADVCARFFAELALRRHKTPSALKEDIYWNSVEDPVYNSLTNIPDTKSVILCLQALGSYSLDEKCCKALVDHKLLDLLWQIWHHDGFAGDRRIRSLILKILSNMSLYPDLKDHIVALGWLAVLHECVFQSDKIELQLLSKKALENLVSYRSDLPKYEDGIYLLHGSLLDRNDFVADVVFVHGIRGGVFRTWRQKDQLVNNRTSSGEPRTQCWPRDWLARDMPFPTRLIAVDYASFITDWSTKCPEFKDKDMIVSRSKELIRKLNRAGVGQNRPVIWVTHSMGGILVKEMLHLMEVDRACADLAPGMLDRTVGCVFYSTPHLGVPFVSNLLERSYRFFLLPSIEVKYLNEDSPQLAALNAAFLDLLKRNDIRCLSFFETVPTKLPWTNYRTVLVPEKSANVVPGYCYRLNERHLNTCKPETRDSVNYRALVQFITQLLQD